MDILTLILAAKLGGGSAGGTLADRSDLAELVAKHQILPAWTDENGAVLVDENYAILIKE